jgi:hypothetical protein
MPPDGTLPFFGLRFDKNSRLGEMVSVQWANAWAGKAPRGISSLVERAFLSSFRSSTFGTGQRRSGFNAWVLDALNERLVTHCWPVRRSRQKCWKFGACPFHSATQPVSQPDRHARARARPCIVYFMEKHPRDLLNFLEAPQAITRPVSFFSQKRSKRHLNNGMQNLKGKSRSHPLRHPLLHPQLHRLLKPTTACGAASAAVSKTLRS